MLEEATDKRKIQIIAGNDNGKCQAEPVADKLQGDIIHM